MSTTDKTSEYPFHLEWVVYDETNPDYLAILDKLRIASFQTRQQAKQVFYYLQDHNPHPPLHNARLHLIQIPQVEKISYPQKPPF